MKDSKSKSKKSSKISETHPRQLIDWKTSGNYPRHEAVWYGIMRRGKVVGGISNPDLFTLEGAMEWVQDIPRNTKIVKIRVTHEVVSEVIIV